MPTAIGIDLGLSYSCSGIYQHGKVEILPNNVGNHLTPSYIAFTYEDQLIGQDAKNQEDVNSRNTVLDVRRLIGCNFDEPSVQSAIKQHPFQIINCLQRPRVKVKYKGKDELYHAEELTSMLLSKIKETADSYLQCNVTDVVVTVPAYFTVSQRQATKDAAKIAGLNTLRIITEQTAAVIAYSLDDMSVSSEHKVLVFNLHERTFDVSILSVDHGLIELIATTGEIHLGGNSFDLRLLNDCIRQVEEKQLVNINLDKVATKMLLKSCNDAKKTLCFLNQASISIDTLDIYTTVTRTKFEELNAGLFQQIMQHTQRLLKSAKLVKSQIHEVVMVGSGTRIPKLGEMLMEYFDVAKLCNHINPDEVVAHGAAVYAAALNDKYRKVTRLSRLRDFF